jgi:predicted nucleotidyltransferase component of viral defense system
MNREELQRYIGITGFSLGQVEKDYFQHIVLGTLSRKVGSSLVFKGGTALQKTGVTSRFSEDIDFTARNETLGKELCEIATDAIKKYNIPVETNHYLQDERTMSFRIKIQGPLYRNHRGICTIRVEISKRETVFLQPEQTEFTPPYANILPYTIDVMQIEEILSEKIRTIYSRQKARDLYDLYKIIKQNIRFDTNLTQKKLDYYDISFEPTIFLKRCELLKSQWSQELQSLMENVPSYQKAFTAVKNMLSE